MDIISGQCPGLLCPLPDSSCWQRVVSCGGLAAYSCPPRHSPCLQRGSGGFFPWAREQEGFLGHFRQKYQKRRWACFTYRLSISCLLALSIRMIGLSPIPTRHWPGTPTWDYMVSKKCNLYYLKLGTSAVRNCCHSKQYMASALPRSF